VARFGCMGDRIEPTCSHMGAKGGVVALLEWQVRLAAVDAAGGSCGWLRDGRWRLAAADMAA
jgi:hypothetical protein